MNSNPAPLSVNLYVRKYPLLNERGDKKVSAAVPTTRCSSPPRAAKDTIAREKAASLLSIGIVAIVLAWVAHQKIDHIQAPRARQTSTGSIMRIPEAHVPAGALGRPNTSGGRLTTSS